LISITGTGVLAFNCKGTINKNMKITIAVAKNLFKILIEIPSLYSINIYPIQYMMSQAAKCQDLSGLTRDITEKDGRFPVKCLCDVVFACTQISVPMSIKHLKKYP